MWLLILDEHGRPRARHDTPPAVTEALAGLGLPGLQTGHLAVHNDGGSPADDPAGSGPDARAAGVLRGSPAVDAAALAALHRRFGVRSADRVRLTPGDARWPQLRAGLRRRHAHADHELRVFVRGRGLFDLPLPDGRRAQLVCEAGDWLAVPPGVPHAFDAGRVPDVDVLRLFSTAEGGLPQPTADADAAPLPDLDALLTARERLLAPA